MTLENYEPVAVRIDKFWKAHPNGRIITDLVEFTGDRVIAKAEIYTDREDARPAAVDFALEIQGSSNVNKNFHLEACITSAIGRALATLNFQGDPTKLGSDARPSKEEMSKVQEYKISRPLSARNVPVKASEKQLGLIRVLCKQLGRTTPIGMSDFDTVQASEVIDQLKKAQEAAQPAEDEEEVF